MARPLFSTNHFATITGVITCPPKNACANPKKKPKAINICQGFSALNIAISESPPIRDPNDIENLAPPFRSANGPARGAIIAIVKVRKLATADMVNEFNPSERRMGSKKTLWTHDPIPPVAVEEINITPIITQP